MTIRRKLITSGLLTAVAILPLVLSANSDGADPMHAGVPGERNCTACHTGTLNSGSGSVKITTPSSTYTLGAAQRIQVQVSDPTQRRWGFQFTARIGTTTAQAGTMSPSDGNTRIVSQSGRVYMTHTLSGTRAGTTAGATFEFDWTPPASDVGEIILYAAGNAANGNNNDSGDRIYTTSVRLAPAAAGAKPTISSSRGIVNAASFRPGISPRSWVTITGSDLSASTRAWSGNDIVDGNLPTSLDDVSVSINGQPGYVQYISPSQINVIAPENVGTGDVEVSVTSGGRTSDPVIATVQSVSPAFFLFDGKYLAATHADNSLLGKAGLFSSTPSATTPAKPGETIVLYGTGFGPTTGGVSAGRLTDRISPISDTVRITIGGVPANVSFAGLVPPFAELYQFNVEVPSTVAAGDQSVVAEISGIASASEASCCFITIER